MAHAPPRIGITLGDPAGVGPELVLRLLSAAEARSHARLVIYGNAALLRRVAEAIHAPWPTDLQVAPLQALGLIPSGTTAPVLLDFPFPEAAVIAPGRVQAACGRMAATWIEAAARDALAGRIDGIVTAPIHKHALRLAGVSHPGHTELLATLTGVPRATMLFWSPRLIVSLATIHLPLVAVPAALTVERLLDTIRLTAAACSRFERARLPIGVLALNPHAGENGLFGDEETRIIRPAIEAAVAEGDPGRRAARAGHGLSQGSTRRARGLCRHVPRPGLDPVQDAGIRGGRERHARPAHRAHLARSWHSL